MNILSLLIRIEEKVFIYPFLDTTFYVKNKKEL